MTDIVNLNGHAIEQIAHYLDAYFDTQDMKTTHAVDEHGSITIKAVSKDESFTNDLVGMKNSCNVVITDKHDGTAQIEAGHGSWANKVTGAAVCVAAFILNPIAGSVLLAGETKNIVDQAELPGNVIAVAKAYVAQAEAPSNRRLSTAGTLVNM